MEIDIYTTSTCFFCIKAKQWLDKNGYIYKEHSLDDPSLREEFKRQHPDAKTVPQIFVTNDGETVRIGGYTDLVKPHPMFV